MSFAVCRRDDYLDGDGWGEWEIAGVFESPKAAIRSARWRRSINWLGERVLPHSVKIVSEYKVIPW